MITLCFVSQRYIVWLWNIKYQIFFLRLLTLSTLLTLKMLCVTIIIQMMALLSIRWTSLFYEVFTFSLRTESQLQPSRQQKASEAFSLCQFMNTLMYICPVFFFLCIIVQYLHYVLYLFHLYLIYMCCHFFHVFQPFVHHPLCRWIKNM